MTTLDRRSALRLLAIPALLGASALESQTGHRFEIYRDRRSGFRWRLRSGNNRTIASSGEAFATKGSCRTAVDLVKRIAGAAPIEDRT